MAFGSRRFKMHPQRTTTVLSAYLTVTLAVAAPALAASKTGPQSAFLAYQQAVLADRGAAAADLVTESTLAYFGDMQQLALYADAAAVRNQSLVNQFQILAFRHRIAPAKLKRMSSRELFELAVDRGWVGKNALGALGPGEVSITGDTATVEILGDGEPTGFSHRFYRENGQWKLDLVPALALGNEAFKVIAQQQGITEEAVILMLLESVSGKPVPKSIWTPPFKSSGQT